jgi:hypothetical protein
MYIMSSEPVDWEHLKWGSFTKQFQAYKRKHPEASLDDLDAFAHHVATNPTSFGAVTKKRANFYLNVLKKGGEMEGAGGSKSSGYIRMLIGKKTENKSLNGRVYGRTPAPPFAIRKVANPSKNLKLYSKYARHLKRHPSQAPPHWSVGVGMGFSMDGGDDSDSDSDSDSDMEGGADTFQKGKADELRQWYMDNPAYTRLTGRNDREVPHPALVSVKGRDFPLVDMLQAVVHSGDLIDQQDKNPAGTRTKSSGQVVSTYNPFFDITNKKDALAQRVLDIAEEELRKRIEILYDIYPDPPHDARNPIQKYPYLPQAPFSEPTGFAEAKAQGEKTRAVRKYNDKLKAEQQAFVARKKAEAEAEARRAEAKKEAERKAKIAENNARAKAEADAKKKAKASATPSKSGKK